mgnify:CR=1 FL=1
MRCQKIICNIKIFLIIGLTFIFLSTIDIAPDTPILFVSITSIIIPLIRCLWRSILKEETLMNKQKNIVPLGTKHKKLKNDKKIA